MRMFNGIGTTVYGNANKEELVGADRLTAEQGGYLPYTYQAVKWFVFLFFPIIPLGTYRVMKSQKHSWPYGEYRMVRVPWDWKQVINQYFLACGGLLIALLIMYALREFTG
jgi:hypothetical protein